MIIVKIYYFLFIQIAINLYSTFAYQFNNLNLKPNNHNAKLQTDQKGLLGRLRDGLLVPKPLPLPFNPLTRRHQISLLLLSQRQAIIIDPSRSPPTQKHSQDPLNSARQLPYQHCDGVG